MSYNMKLETFLTCKDIDIVKARRQQHYCIVQGFVYNEAFSSNFVYIQCTMQ